jgi:hypothetical protein
MKKLTFRIISITLPIFILIILVNFYVDPANLFNHKYVSGIIAYINKGYNVTHVSNYDERQFQKKWIDGFIKNPTTIVLGSSKSM